MYIQFNEKQCNLNDRQAVIEQRIDVKIKTSQQAFLLAQMSLARYFCVFALLKSEKSGHQKNSGAKKNHHLCIINSLDKNRV